MANPSRTNAEFDSPIKVGIASVYSGSGVPNIEAVTSSIFMRTDSTSTTTRLYVHTGATWTAFTSIA